MAIDRVTILKALLISPAIKICNMSDLQEAFVTYIKEAEHNHNIESTKYLSNVVLYFN